MLEVSKIEVCGDLRIIRLIAILMSRYMLKGREPFQTTHLRNKQMDILAVKDKSVLERYLMP